MTILSPCASGVPRPSARSSMPDRRRLARVVAVVAVVCLAVVGCGAQEEPLAGSEAARAVQRAGGVARALSSHASVAGLVMGASGASEDALMDSLLALWDAGTGGCVVAERAGAVVDIVAPEAVAGEGGAEAEEPGCPLGPLRLEGALRVELEAVSPAPRWRVEAGDGLRVGVAGRGSLEPLAGSWTLRVPAGEPAAWSLVGVAVGAEPAAREISAEVALEDAVVVDEEGAVLASGLRLSGAVAWLEQDVAWSGLLAQLVLVDGSSVPRSGVWEQQRSGGSLYRVMYLARTPFATDVTVTARGDRWRGCLDEPGTSDCAGP